MSDESYLAKWERVIKASDSLDEKRGKLVADIDYAGLIDELEGPDGNERTWRYADAMKTLLKERDDLQAKYAVLNEAFAKLEDELAALEKELILAKASADGAGSLLLDVQQDCIKEKARADALEKWVGRLREALAEIEVKQCENYAQTIVSMRLTARAALAETEEGK